MKSIVNVVTSSSVVLEHFWVIRGVKVDEEGAKKVIAEQEALEPPTDEMIAKFLVDFPEVSFCSVQPNYRIAHVE